MEEQRTINPRELYQTDQLAKYSAFTDLKGIYNILVSKRNDLLSLKQPKMNRKEELLKGKLESTLTASEALELNHIEDEERIEIIKNDGIAAVRSKVVRSIESIKEKVLRDIENIKEKAERDIESIENGVEIKIQFYETQAAQMTKKANQTYNTKKATLERKETMTMKEQEFLKDNKTSAEYTNERNIQEVLKKMNNIIYQIKIGKDQFKTSGIKLQDDVPLPVLPEPLNKKILPNVDVIQPVEPVLPPPSEPVVRVMPPQVILEFQKDEDSLQEMRKHRLRLNAQLLRAEEEQKERDREIYMENLRIKQEAEVKRQDERRKQELQGIVEPPIIPTTISEEDEDFKESFKEFMMTDEEVMARSKVLREEYKPPLTPFGGLPAPDSRPKYSATNKKPVKTVRPAGILYATPIEIT